MCYNLTKALSGILSGNLSISEGAKLSGLTYRDFYDKIVENKIKISFDEKALGKSSKKLLENTNKKMQRAGFEPAKH